uniref:Abhydrolase domain containing 14B n=1 Tax=Ovis aries TaxID=9940 RepID=A0AC11DU45_SHEEP
EDGSSIAAPTSLRRIAATSGRPGARPSPRPLAGHLPPSPHQPLPCFPAPAPVAAFSPASSRSSPGVRLEFWEPRLLLQERPLPSLGQPPCSTWAGRSVAPAQQQNLGTLHRLAQAGYRAVAIDLPGLGRSKEAKAPAPIGELVPSSFLAAVVDALDLGPPVVISPSLSGMYSLPFLTAPGSQLRGYVPVAPICTDKINAADYARVKASVLIVYGDQDPMGQTSFEHLKQLPNHRVLVMEGAGHPCYLDKPEEWHTGLLDFLRGLA